MTTRQRMAPLRYDPSEIDRKWQQRWADDNLYQVNDDDPRPRWYALTMYPYPSGDLHIGHWYAMAPSDAHARFMRMRGYNVLHPMGFDAFGLPAENAAINRGIHPSIWTMENIERMRSQLRSMGAVYDWDREIVTCQPDYYAWNQWFFLKMYEQGLAYRASAPVNWCPTCQTVLANEQVVDGKCERTGDVVIRREMDQWFFRITDYADELLDFSNVVDWPERIRTMQTNWIGRSEGLDISFDISEYGLDEHDITTFTTRIDTIFGVTFVVLAPEHPLVERLTTPEQRDAVQAYVASAREATEIDRLSVEREKTGVFTGSYAVNPLNGDRVPIWMGDYVLLTYGTGAVMGVPAHDARDFDFARKYGLEIRVVVAPPGWNGAPLREAWLEKRGSQVNSGRFNGMPNAEGYEAIADQVEQQGWGTRTVGYRMRDWLISRQRYWGTPIPIVYCEACGAQPVPYDQLPVVLPDDGRVQADRRVTAPLPRRFPPHVLPRLRRPRHPRDRHDGHVRGTHRGTSCATSAPTSARARSTPLASARGTRSTSTPAARSTPSCTCSTPASLPRSSATWASSTSASRFLRLFNQGTVLSGHMKMSKSRGTRHRPGRIRAQPRRGRRAPLPDVHGPMGGRRRLERLRHQRRRPLGEPPLGPLFEGHRRAARGQCRLRPSGNAQDAPDGPRRHRGAGALQVQHRHRRDDGADQRDVPRLRRRRRLTRRVERGGRVAGPAARADGAPPRRGALGTHRSLLQRPQPAPAGVGRGPGRHRGGDARRTGERQGARPHRRPASISEGDAREAALTSQKVLAYTDGKPVDKVVFVPGRYLVSVVVKD